MEPARINPKILKGTIYLGLPDEGMVSCVCMILPMFAPTCFPVGVLVLIRQLPPHLLHTPKSLP